MHIADIVISELCYLLLIKKNKSELCYNMLILINDLTDSFNNDLCKFVLRLRLSYDMKLYCSMPMHTFFSYTFMC